MKIGKNWNLMKKMKRDQMPQEKEKGLTNCPQLNTQSQPETLPLLALPNASNPSCFKCGAIPVGKSQTLGSHSGKSNYTYTLTEEEEENNRYGS